MAGTPRLLLPFLSVGQAQKEFTHNEALQILDMLVAGAVDEPPRASPPDSPGTGACYIVDEAASGDWAGKPQCVAAWTTGGWRFVAPAEGMRFLVRSSGVEIAFRAGAWEMGSVRANAILIEDQQVLASRAAAIASPSGGASPDAEARAAIDSILEALRHHGLIET